MFEEKLSARNSFYSTLLNMVYDMLDWEYWFNRVLRNFSCLSSPSVSSQLVIFLYSVAFCFIAKANLWRLIILNSYIFFMSLFWCELFFAISFSLWMPPQGAIMSCVLYRKIRRKKATEYAEYLKITLSIRGKFTSRALKLVIRKTFKIRMMKILKKKLYIYLLHGKLYRRAFQTLQKIKKFLIEEKYFTVFSVVAFHVQNNLGIYCWSYQLVSKWNQSTILYFGHTLETWRRFSSIRTNHCWKSFTLSARFFFLSHLKVEKYEIIL